ncbi:MAG: LamB/YcsF family protein [Chitinophagaceae bacterium]|nr:LamB/YcsF family protein [Chitinophagaceae bacterium]
MTIDLNADLGEGLSTDADLIPLISSANIACGYHAGDRETMIRTVEHCLQHGVAVGAHPSFPDREHFGRKEMTLEQSTLQEILLAQLNLMAEVCNQTGATFHHVKPHGALYNMSARDAGLARLIAETVFDYNPGLKLFGLSGSHSIAEGVMAGLTTVAEVFADRTYLPDGSLTPRTEPNALINESGEAIRQALSLALENKVVATNGKVIDVMAESICLHGDGPHAVSFARMIHRSFSEHGITIRAVQ